MTEKRTPIETSLKALFWVFILLVDLETVPFPMQRSNKNLNQSIKTVDAW